MGKIRKVFQYVICWQFYPECFVLSVFKFEAFILLYVMILNTSHVTWCPHSCMTMQKVPYPAPFCPQILAGAQDDIWHTALNLNIQTLKPIVDWMNSPHYILEDSYFNFRYVRLCDWAISTENWLNYLQTVETQIRWAWSAASDLGLHYLPVTLLGASRLHWVNPWPCLKFEEIYFTACYFV